jgi:DNA-binding response OmpR family regulator
MYGTGIFRREAGMAELVLIVDDEESIVRLVEYNLQKAGFRTAVAYDAAGALLSLAREEPDAIVLDVMLPDMDGFELCRQIRRTSDTPVLFLTARGAESEKIAGLELGADDYLTKPFSPGELVARLRAVLRRARPVPAGGARDGARLEVPRPLRWGGLLIDPGRRELSVDGQEVVLTAREFDLLLAMAENHGLVLTREQLLTRVWGADFFGDPRVVDVHVRHLREKLGPAHEVIQTVRGVGYKFRPVPYGL